MDWLLLKVQVSWLMVHGLVAFKSAITLNSDWSFFIYIMNDNFKFFCLTLYTNCNSHVHTIYSFCHYFIIVTFDTNL